MKYCMNCGNPLRGNEKFCGHCGAKIRNIPGAPPQFAGDAGYSPNRSAAFVSMNTQSALMQNNRKEQPEEKEINPFTVQSATTSGKSEPEPYLMPGVYPQNAVSSDSVGQEEMIRCAELTTILSEPELWEGGRKEIDLSGRKYIVEIPAGTAPGTRLRTDKLKAVDPETGQKICVLLRVAVQ